MNIHMSISAADLGNLEFNSHKDIIEIYYNAIEKRDLENELYSDCI
jgi:hypothetical protein